MDIRVSGHQVDVGDVLRSHAIGQLRATDEKYAMRTVSAQVTFGKGPHDHGFTCEIIAYAPQGLVLKALERSPDAHAAYDAALDKIAKQMRRNTRRQKDHRAEDRAEALVDAEPASERRGGA